MIGWVTDANRGSIQMRLSRINLNVNLNSSLSYCRNLVQRLDNSAYLLSYFYPKYSKDDYFTLKAFNIELATIKYIEYIWLLIGSNCCIIYRDSVSRDIIGQMRIQFWRDTINNVYRVSLFSFRWYLSVQVIECTLGQTTKRASSISSIWKCAEIWITKTTIYEYNWW